MLLSKKESSCAKMQNFFCQKCEILAKHKIRYDEASFYCYYWHPYSQIREDRHQNLSTTFKNAKVTTKNVYSHSDSCDCSGGSPRY